MTFDWERRDVAQFIKPIFGTDTDTTRNFLTVQGSLIAYVSVPLGKTTSGKAKADAPTVWFLSTVQVAQALCSMAQKTPGITFEDTIGGVQFTITLTENLAQPQTYTGIYSTTAFSSTSEFIIYLRSMLLSLVPNIAVLDYNTAFKDKDGQVAYLLGVPGSFIYMLYDRKGDAETLSETWTLSQDKVIDVLSDLSAKLSIDNDKFDLVGYETSWVYSSNLFKTPADLQAAMIPVLCASLGGGVALTQSSDQQSWLFAANAKAGLSLVYFDFSISAGTYSTKASNVVSQSSLSDATVAVTDSAFTVTSTVDKKTTVVLDGITYDKSLYGSSDGLQAVVQTMINVATNNSANANKIIMFENTSGVDLSIFCTQVLATEVAVASGATLISSAFGSFNEGIAATTDNDGTYVAHFAATQLNILIGVNPPVPIPVQTITITSDDLSQMNDAITFFANTWVANDSATAKADQAIFKQFTNTISSFASTATSGSSGSTDSGAWAIAAGLFNNYLLQITNSLSFSSAQLALAMEWYLLPKYLDGTYTVYENPGTAKVSPFQKKYQLGTLDISSAKGATNTLNSLQLAFKGHDLTLGTGGPLPNATGTGVTALQIDNFFETKPKGDLIKNFTGSMTPTGGSSTAIIGTTLSTSSGGLTTTEIIEMIIGMAGAGAVMWVMQMGEEETAAEVDAVANVEPGSLSYYAEAAQVRAARNMRTTESEDIQMSQGASDQVRSNLEDEIESVDDDAEETAENIITEENEGGNPNEDVVRDAENLESDVETLTSDAGTFVEADTVAALDADVSTITGMISKVTGSMSSLAKDPISEPNVGSLTEEEQTIEADEATVISSEPADVIPDEDDDPIDTVPEVEAF